MTLQTMMTTTPAAEPQTAELEAADVQATTAAEGEADSPAETAAAVDIRGAQLSDAETAAVVAVLARLATAEPVSSDAGSTGPTDRAVQRRHRLQLDQHGLWGRPGPSSWQAAGGIG